MKYKPGTLLIMKGKAFPQLRFDFKSISARWFIIVIILNATIYIVVVMSKLSKIHFNQLYKIKLFFS